MPDVHCWAFERRPTKTPSIALVTASLLKSMGVLDRLLAGQIISQSIGGFARWKVRSAVGFIHLGCSWSSICRMVRCSSSSYCWRRAFR